MPCDRRATSVADVTGTSIARARVHEERSLRFPKFGVLRIGQRCRDARSSPEAGWSRRPHGRASDRDAPIELVAERGGHGDSREIVRTAERDPDSPPIDRPARRRCPLSFEIGADSSRGAEVAEASRIAARSPWTFCSDPDSRQRPAHLTRAKCGRRFSRLRLQTHGLVESSWSEEQSALAWPTPRSIPRRRLRASAGETTTRAGKSRMSSGIAWVRRTRKTNGQSGWRPAGARTGGAAAGA